ncbi:MAG: HTH domain-containing protein [Candidatus Bathyarchaeota archaeon]|nr:HTH domain-containing protein [Candidatus Bathyarchaeota archaeon]
MKRGRPRGSYASEHTILKVVLQQNLSAGEIIQTTGLSKNTVLKCLKILQGKGVMAGQRIGRNVIYSVKGGYYPELLNWIVFDRIKKGEKDHKSLLKEIFESLPEGYDETGTHDKEILEKTDWESFRRYIKNTLRGGNEVSDEESREHTARYFRQLRGKKKERILWNCVIFEVSEDMKVLMRKAS